MYPPVSLACWCQSGLLVSVWPGGATMAWWYQSGLVVPPWPGGASLAWWCQSDLVVPVWPGGTSLAWWCQSDLVVPVWPGGASLTWWCQSGLVVPVWPGGASLAWWCQSGLVVPPWPGVTSLAWWCQSGLVVGVNIMLVETGSFSEDVRSMRDSQWSWQPVEDWAITTFVTCYIKRKHVYAEPKNQCHSEYAVYIFLSSEFNTLLTGTQEVHDGLSSTWTNPWKDIFCSRIRNKGYLQCNFNSIMQSTSCDGHNKPRSTLCCRVLPSHSLTHCCAWPAEGRSILHIERSWPAIKAAPTDRPTSSSTCCSQFLHKQGELLNC